MGAIRTRVLDAPSHVGSRPRTQLLVDCPDRRLHAPAEPRVSSIEHTVRETGFRFSSIWDPRLLHLLSVPHGGRDEGQLHARPQLLSHQAVPDATRCYYDEQLLGEYGGHPDHGARHPSVLRPSVCGVRKWIHDLSGIWRASDVHQGTECVVRPQRVSIFDVGVRGLVGVLLVVQREADVEAEGPHGGVFDDQLGVDTVGNKRE
mmetsp:Transcript_20217/g.36333  ORF Transcript_20217/g.36333 Transcript_20217/m.36333 type:complete len:204 (+) Transcript_20217:1182-1793(+)